MEPTEETLIRIPACWVPAVLSARAYNRHGEMAERLLAQAQETRRADRARLLAQAKRAAEARARETP